MQNEYLVTQEEPQRSVIKGLIGALLGALLGAAAYALITILTSKIYAMAGLLIGFLAATGYDLLKGRYGVPKLICVLLCVVIGVCVGTAAVTAWDIHTVYQEQLEELSPIMRSMAISEKEFFEVVLADSEVKGEVVKNLLTGLAFAALGCIGMFRSWATKPEDQQPAAESGDISAAAVPQNGADQPAQAELPSSDDSAFN